MQTYQGQLKQVFFAKEFPERFFDMGISEQDMIDTAAGLATCGKIPLLQVLLFLQQEELMTKYEPVYVIQILM